MDEMVEQKAVSMALGMLHRQGNTRQGEPGRGEPGQVEELLVNLLANLTTSEAGCRSLLGLQGESTGSWSPPPSPPPSGRIATAVGDCDGVKLRDCPRIYHDWLVAFCRNCEQ